MVYRTFFILILSCLIISCKDTKTNYEVERISLTPTHVVCDSIESMMPGELFYTGEYLLWTDPFHSERFVHVLDAKTGKEINSAIQRGEGPHEFLTPNLTLAGEDKLFVYDYNSKKTALLSIEKIIRDENPLLESGSRDMGGITQVLVISKNELVFFSPADKLPFVLEKNGSKVPFGKLPVEEEVRNGYDVFQGMLIYHPDKKKLFYSTYGFPYMAIYKQSGNSFSLERENFRNTKYNIIDEDKFIYKEQEKGARGIALLKDYIVTLERDRTVDETDDNKVGRDFMKLPQTVFLYDYDLNLRKIINLGMPVLRLASDPSSNTLFTIGVNPDFVLMEYEL